MCELNLNKNVHLTFSNKIYVNIFAYYVTLQKISGKNYGEGFRDFEFCCEI